MPQYFDTQDWQVWVLADSSGKWASNNIRHATREDAEAAAKDLARRWTLVREWTVTLTTEPPSPRVGQ
jgi:hypothetical protein